ncbi:sister chromatid cohesion protein Dcc1 [Boletus reticuloceps]|uniref:Sister chromatid cohesion protein Dcc1 n=1 Tax=Boletus reticuloceps TaxID=495285 RepID=A0A8I2YTN1_9AGAM|nr:sister chromatid cohesion protein Dcc1 [Boletus reticuloceps]
MSDLEIRFSPSTEQDAGAFRLVELPSELCQLIDSAVETKTSQPILSIKGHPTEDAVVCTADKNYTLRSVVLSNTVLVLTPSRTDPDGTVHVRDQLHDVLELVPSVPKLHKLSVLLRGMEYDEGDEDLRTTLPKYSYEQARAEIQASESELRVGLRERRVLVLDGYLRPIAPAHLNTILELLLNYLISLSLVHDAAPVDDLVSALADDHDISRGVSIQVMSWFGRIEENTWKMDVNAVVAEIGLGIIRHYKLELTWHRVVDKKHEPILETEFMTKWKNAVGDTFESAVLLQLLSVRSPPLCTFSSNESDIRVQRQGNYLRNTNNVLGTTLNYFAASALPTDAAARFAELFLTHPRWKGDEIEPFLSDISVNAKERDKLLLKHARAITTPEGTWYTARVGYNN